MLMGDRRTFQRRSARQGENTTLQHRCRARICLIFAHFSKGPPIDFIENDGRNRWFCFEQRRVEFSLFIACEVGNPAVAVCANPLQSRNPVVSAPFADPRRVRTSTTGTRIMLLPFAIAVNRWPAISFISFRSAAGRVILPDSDSLVPRVMDTSRWKISRVQVTSLLPREQWPSSSFIAAGGASPTPRTQPCPPKGRWASGPPALHSVRNYHAYSHPPSE